MKIKTNIFFNGQRRFEVLNFLLSKDINIKQIFIPSKNIEDLKKNKILTKYKSTMNKYALIDNFINSIKKNVDPIVNTLDVFRAMDICFSIYESIIKKKTIKVSYLM